MAEPKQIGEGRWAARPRIGGRQAYIVVNARGIREARRAVAEQVAQLERGERTVGRKPTFAAAAERWITSAAMAPATVRNHREVLRHCAGFAGTRIDKVAVRDVELAIEGLGPSTARRTLTLVSGVFRDCIRLGELGDTPGTNLALRVRRPPTVRRREVHLTAADVAAVVEAAWTRDGRKAPELEHVALALLMTALTGMRRAELVALRWDAVDLEAPALRVVRRASADEIVDGAKTAAGARRVPLSPAAAAVLRRMAEIRPGDGFVWSPVPDGSMPYKAGWLTRACALAAAAAEVECSPHRLRHFAASALADAGIPVPSIAGLLGHASVATLAYLHAVDARVVEAADVLGAVLPPISVGGRPVAELPQLSLDPVETLPGQGV